MKKKFLLITSMVFIVAALAVMFVVPIMATTGANGASIQKNTVNNNNGTLTSTITVTNNNATASITLTSMYDVVYHAHSTVVSADFISPGTVDVLAGATYSYDYTYSLLDGDGGTYVDDTVYVTGTNNALTPGHNVFTLSYPDTILVPAPELSAGILLGMGMLGLGGFVLLNRKKSMVTN